MNILIFDTDAKRGHEISHLMECRGHQWKLVSDIKSAEDAIILESSFDLFICEYSEASFELMKLYGGVDGVKKFVFITGSVDDSIECLERGVLTCMEKEGSVFSTLLRTLKGIDDVRFSLTVAFA